MSDIHKQRTYALVGTGGCGKTTLAEMILLHAGVVSRLGKIEDGNTVLDFEPEEVKRRGSTQPGFAAFLVVVILTAPIQAAAEEYFFRGYLMQALGSLVAQPWMWRVLFDLLLIGMFGGFFIG